MLGMDHVVTTEQVRGLSNVTWYQAVCSCGVITARYVFPGRADAAGRQHVREVTSRGTR